VRAGAGFDKLRSRRILFWDLMDDLRHNLDLLGFSIVPDLLNSDEIDGLLAALSAVEASDAVRKRGGFYAIRNLLQVVPAVARLAESDKEASRLAGLASSGRL
jgi:hypothetical protein